jgi:hypothetical protein
MKVYTLDQQRAAVNLGDAYDAWMEAERATFQGRLRWKTVAGKDYLYHLRKGSDTGTSLGPRSAETEQRFAEGRALEDQARNGAKRLLLLGRIYKAARLPLVPTFAGDILRNFDRHGLLGPALQVIGTNALSAYELEAGCALNQELRATEDFDLSWTGPAIEPPPRLLEVMHETDATWTVSMERSFQVVNRHLDVVDVLVAPSLLGNYPPDKWQAIDTPGQEDLLGGSPVTQVVADFSGQPARLVVPDPRRFALHKLLLSQSDERQGLKRKKDFQQAQELRHLIETAMPSYPFDEAFLDSLSPRLQNAWTGWAATPGPAMGLPKVTGPARRHPKMG